MHKSINLLGGVSDVSLFPLSTPGYSQNAKLIESSEERRQSGRLWVRNPIMPTQSFRCLRKKLALMYRLLEASATKVMDRALSDIRPVNLSSIITLPNILPMKIMWKEGILHNIFFSFL